MAIPQVPVIEPVSAFNWLDPSLITQYALLAVVIILIIRIIWNTKKDISGQRVIEEDGGILTISSVKNDAVKEKTLTYSGNRTAVIDHPPYRIITTFGVHLTLWFVDALKGRTIGLQNNSLLKDAMGVDEQHEIIRAIPEKHLGTIIKESGVSLTLLTLGAGAFLGYMLRGFFGG